jgi:hypothetical protein
MVPASYLPSKWRCTLPVDPEAGVLGIAFDYPVTGIARLRLSVADARLLADSLTEALAAYDGHQVSEEKPTLNQVLSELSSIKRELRLRSWI